MISFMVLAGPRSATTWMANLLTTDTTLCLHDPLLEHTSVQLDQVNIPGRRIGISCTAALLWPEWLRAHRAKKVILWRNPQEINASLRELGLRELDPAKHCMRVHGLPGVRLYPWDSVFKWHSAQSIADHLEVPLDRWRFEELRKMNIQPQFSRIPLGKEAVRELVRRLGKELE